MELLKLIPKVDVVLQHDDFEGLCGKYGRAGLVESVRIVMDDLRDAIKSDLITDEPDTDAAHILEKAAKRLSDAMMPKLKRVVNATGIILHTGLGRAVMPPAVRAALADLTGCCNIQMDLETGARIKRESCVRDLVRDLTGAEDVAVVNNNAGATMLVLKALSEGMETVVSRGELIEIGGSFRLPDIMEQSGAVLKEVGATNKTHLRDYEDAVSDRTGLLFKAHKSNYCIVGFTKEVTIGGIAEVGRKHGIPVVDDLGCGALVSLSDYGLEHEMTMRESLEAGADIVLVSTDKLIGGPQGGLIAGKAEYIDKIRKHPLYRALRVDKMTLAALEATLRLFMAPELLAENHPVYFMLGRTTDEMNRTAGQLAERIKGVQPDWRVTVVEDESRLGGGSLPASSMPSLAVSIQSESESAQDISLRLRGAAVPVISHICNDSVYLNIRTVLPSEFEDVVSACG